MLKYSKGQKISINLTLINNDGTPEENATVNYKIYDDSNTLMLSGDNLAYNSTLGSYIDVIDPSVDWPNQQEGVYYIMWEISDTLEDYPNSAVEEMYIERYDDKLDELITNTESISGNNISSFDNLESKVDSLSATNQNNFDNIDNKLDDQGEKLDRLLGLSHEDITIDQAVYDEYGNLESARLRLYSNPDSVGTDSDIIAEYEITANTTDIGRFITWQQKRVD